jgi:predicted metal-dependent peptidase
LRAARLQPYLASAVFSLVPVLSPGYGTFGVDRWWRVYVDMDVARQWGVEATAAVLLHEANHVVRDHHNRAARMGVRPSEHLLWNLAGDAAINDDLMDERLPLPDPVLPAQLGLEPGQMEEVYFRHLTRQLEHRERASCGSGSGGASLSIEIPDEPEPGPDGTDGVDEVDAGAIRRAVAHEVVEASERDEAVSPGLIRWAQDLLNPQVPWRTLLRAAVGRCVRAESARSRPDWGRPDRRAESRPDFPQPGKRYFRPDIAVVIDTSASMSNALLNAAVTEINSLLHRSGIAAITVITCDAAAARPQRIRRLGELTLSGGGGTDLRIGIEAAAAQRPRPTTIVVITDGLTPWPTEAPTRTNLVAVVIGHDAALPIGSGITSLRIEEPS